MLISIIIPALNEAENIRQAVAAARRGYSPEEVEIIVVDGGSTDGTLLRLRSGQALRLRSGQALRLRSGQADMVPRGVALIRSPRGRAVQMNRGAAASHGEILVFCHADSQLPAGWREAITEALARPGVSGGTFQTLLMPARGVILHVRNRIRFPANWKIMFGDQVQFMSRATFEQVGGFPDIPLMEDVEMSRALHRIGRLVRIPLHVTTSSRRFLERGALRQWLLNIWSMIRYLYLGATPEDIVQVYRSSREETR
jgi:rSAM/selenodomain-associated transferase 2